MGELLLSLFAIVLIVGMIWFVVRVALMVLRAVVNASTLPKGKVDPYGYQGDDERHP